jgi:co-chaperonin GroES (HSP10)
MIILGKQPISGTLTPTGNGVLLAPILTETVSPGGIHLVESERWNNDVVQWRVVAVGPGAPKLDKKGLPKGPVIPITDVSVGDYVLCRLEHKGYALDDGTGRVIVEVDQIEMVYQPTPATAFGGDA